MPTPMMWRMPSLKMEWKGIIPTVRVDMEDEPNSADMLREPLTVEMRKGHPAVAEPDTIVKEPVDESRSSAEVEREEPSDCKPIITGQLSDQKCD